MSTTLASSIQSFAGRVCNNNVTHDNLRFQIPYRNSIINASLPRESLLFLQCCVQMASPSVIWEVNSRPVEKYGDIFTLLEQGQVLYSNVYPPTGYYGCTATNGAETIMQTFVIREDKGHPCCQYGAVGEITKDKPPTDVYNVDLHQTLQLECVAKIRCGFEYMANFLQWRKLDLRTNIYTYSLRRLKPYDGATGDYVNVSYTYESSCGALTIMANLTITNVSQSDLFYQNESALIECDPSNGTCSEISATAGYACSLIMPGTDDPSQKTANTKTLVRLHAVPPTAPPSAPPPMIILASAPACFNVCESTWGALLNEAYPPRTFLARFQNSSKLTADYYCNIAYNVSGCFDQCISAYTQFTSPYSLSANGALRAVQLCKTDDAKCRAMDSLLWCSAYSPNLCGATMQSAIQSAKDCLSATLTQTVQYNNDSYNMPCKFLTNGSAIISDIVNVLNYLVPSPCPVQATARPTVSFVSITSAASSMFLSTTALLPYMAFMLRKRGIAW